MKITRKVIAMIVVFGLLQLNILVAANTSTIDYSNSLDNISSNSSSNSNTSVSGVSTEEINKVPLPQQELSTITKTNENEQSNIINKVTDKWETNVRTYKNEDESYVATSYMEPVNYLKDGQWTEIDNTLILTSDKSVGDVYQNTRNSFKATFPKIFSQAGSVTMEKDDYSISWSLDPLKNSEILDSEAEISNYISQETGLTDNEKLMDAGKTRSSILYESIFTDIDLRYTIAPEKIKEDIILNKPSLIKSFVFNLKAPGLKAKINDDNSISFFNSDKPDVKVFYIPAPFMMDSSEEQTISCDVTMELSETDNGYDLTITPAAAWINAPDRVFPIFIDPTVSSSQVQQDIIDTYVHTGDAAGNHTLSTLLVVGNKTSTNESKCRSLIKTEIPTLPSVIVSDARLNLSITSGSSTFQNLNVYKINEAWSSSTMTWNTAENILDKTLIQSNLPATSYSNSPSSYRYSCNVTSAMQDIYAGRLTNYGFLVRYTNDTYPDYNRFYSSDYTTSTTVRPQLVVTYAYAQTSGIQTNGIYFIRNKNSGKYINAEGTGDGTDVRQRVYTANTNQQWKAIYQNDGTYKLQAMNTTDKYLEVAYNSNSDGTNINIFGGNYTEQYWYIMKNPYDSSYRLLSKCSDYIKGAIVEGASNTDGANIYQYTYTSGGNDEDDWEFDYYGCRPYEIQNSTVINCAGYALDNPSWINFGITLSGLNNCSNEAELWTYTKNMVNAWLDSNMSGDHGSISSYDTFIYLGEWRVVLRMGYQDDGDGVIDIDNNNHDIYDFHWWYQTNTGQWAEKNGDNVSHLVSGTSGFTNPYDISWPSSGFSSFYDSSCIYYGIND
jgi:hypothetical protein